MALDLELHVAFMRDTAIRVRPKEASLLRVLLRGAGRVVAYEEIALALYGARISPETSRARLKSLVAEMRRRFGPEMQDVLVTVPSVGLLLCASSTAVELQKPCSVLVPSCVSREFVSHSRTCQVP